MIHEYFESSGPAEHLLSGCVGPYIEEFVTVLAGDGFAFLTIQENLRTVAHLARWADLRRIDLASWNDDTLARFRRHLSRCRCTKQSKGVFRRAVRNAARFFAHLRAHDVIVAAIPVPPAHRFTTISEQFAAWMLRHRGIAPRTADRYQRALRTFIAQLGEDPAKYRTATIRTFVIEQIGVLGRGETRSAVTAIRAFLRFLVAEGRVHGGIEHSVPTVPQWRLSSLPRYLEASDLDRVVASCDQSTRHGLRDRAVLLLLARLGLRAGDVVGMTLDDVDWKRGTLRVRGKGRQEALLPLPQDVGEAVLAYVERGRSSSTSDRVFLAMNAPTRPLASSATVSGIVCLALRRAGVQNPPSRGAHLLRHSAATAMLRAGGSLDTIATVLRHQSPDTTAYYAKVDVALLQTVAQPWPGGVAC